jgi:hypothetical protein
LDKEKGITEGLMGKEHSVPESQEQDLDEEGGFRGELMGWLCRWNHKQKPAWLGCHCTLLGGWTCVQGQGHLGRSAKAWFAQGWPDEVDLELHKEVERGKCLVAMKLVTMEDIGQDGERRMAGLRCLVIQGK